jgi:predicted protein tyrosine phosphatase
MTETTAPRHAKLPFLLGICGVDGLPDTLGRFKPTHVISIRDPAADEIEFLPGVEVLHLAFHDVHRVDGMVGRMLARQRDPGIPGIDHADAILRFGRQIPPKARVLVHCQAGFSRSPAAAFLIAARAMAGAERRAFDLIKVLRPQCRPNRLIVGFGDKLLGAGGRMISCL